MEKIGILGGTFNPIHNTHIDMAKAALSNYNLSEIWVMPAKIPPNKLGVEIVADNHRYEMVKLALDEENNIFPSDFELLRDDISYTSDTIILLKEKYPDVEFCFIIGGDSVLYLEDWHNPQTIFDNVVILYVSRIGSEADKCKEHIENVLKKNFDNVRLVEITFEVNAVSSTEIRKHISEGMRDANQLGINQKVMDYILKNGLYKES